ncbi:MAG: hypothetical protein WCC61_10920 [Pseudomonas sp.]|jgi:hypothetical protein|uniref:hypothetical protein n=1 Tax=Pseudomonas sp. TaxID=306 RepID=UPI003C7E99DC
MSRLGNVVMVDWRSGKDQIYFFFKDYNIYSRFSIPDNEVPRNYPREVSGNWSNFHNAYDLRFGFTTTGFDTEEFDGDILWLFHYHEDRFTPCVSKYDQDNDHCISTVPVSESRWKQLTPYFDRIVAGTWWQTIPGRAHLFRFLLDNGKALKLDFGYETLIEEPIDDETWPGLAKYQDRIMTAAQNDRTFADSYWYLFLNKDEYIRYNIQENRVVSEPIKIDNESWPGLLRY